MSTPLALRNSGFKSALLSHEESAEALAQRFLNILDSLPQMVWADEDGGKTDYFNRQWQEFTGVDVGAEGDSARISLLHPDDRERAREAWTAAQSTGIYEVEYRLRHRSGEYRWVLSSGTPQRDAEGRITGWYGTCTEIHDRKIARETLDRSVALNRSIVETNPDAMLLLDRDANILFLNQSAKDAVGAERAAAVIGKPYLQVFKLDQRPDARRALDAALAGRSGSFAIPWDGERQWWDIALTAVLDDFGQPLGILVVGRDVSHVKQVESRLQEVQSELIHVARISAMGAMASTLAHELNQPLTAISSYMAGGKRLLREQPFDIEMVMEALTQAGKSAERAGEIIRRLRSLAKGGPAFRKPIDLAVTIADAMALALVGSAELEITTEFDAVPGILVDADAVQLQQVMINLVRNAVDAMIHSDPKILRIAVVSESGEARVTVSDTGPGLSDHMKKHLFEAFETSKENGLGIGLSICRTIVEAHEGRIAALDNEEGGTTFSITLPLSAGQLAAAENQSG